MAVSDDCLFQLIYNRHQDKPVEEVVAEYGKAKFALIKVENALQGRTEAPPTTVLRQEQTYDVTPASALRQEQIHDVHPAPPPLRQGSSYPTPSAAIQGQEGATGTFPAATPQQENAYELTPAATLQHEGASDIFPAAAQQQGSTNELAPATTQQKEGESGTFLLQGQQTVHGMPTPPVVPESERLGIDTPQASQAHDTSLPSPDTAIPTPTVYEYTSEDLERNPQKAIGDNYIVCCLCGEQMQSLGRHLKAKHGISAERYREICGYSKDVPLMSRNAARAAAERMNLARDSRSCFAPKKPGEEQSGPQALPDEGQENSEAVAIPEPV